jgi:hypothetical protein
MSIRWTLTAVVLAGVLLATGLTAVTAAGDPERKGIVYDEDSDAVTIATGNATIDISKLYPAAMIRAANDTSGNGYGVMVSSLVGYNASDALENPLADARYHAPMTGAVWQTVGPVETTDEARGDTVSFALKATVDMTRRTVGSGSGSGAPGQPGPELIRDWAEVQFTFLVSTKGHQKAYEGFPDYFTDINGSTEVRFEVNVRLNKDIYADRLAIDIGLCLMEAGSLVVAPSEEPYRFYGYQADGVSTSNPAVNETNGSTPVIHRFQYRNSHEQMFAFVEDGVEKGYFAWANKVMLNWSAGNSSLTDSTAHYGTDGECLRLYLSSPIGPDVTAVTLDPSVGIYALSGANGGIVRPPDDGGILGASAMSVNIGILIGGVVIGSGVAVLYASRRREEDPADVVSLEKNRYYRGGRR